MKDQKYKQFSLLGKKGKTKWKPVETAQIINPNAPRKLATSSWADETNDLEGKLYQARLIRIILYGIELSLNETV